MSFSHLQLLRELLTLDGFVQDSIPALQRVLLGENDYYRFGTLIGVPAVVVAEILSEKNDMKDRAKGLMEYSLKNNSSSFNKITIALTDLIQEKFKPSGVVSRPAPSLASASASIVVAPPVPPKEITVKVQEEIAESLDKLRTEFTMLVIDIRDALENEVKLNRLILFVEIRLGDTFKPDNPCQNIDDVFESLKEHYCFIKYKILKILVDALIRNEATPSAIKDYGDKLNKWLKSTTLQEFKVAVEKAATSVPTDPSPNQCPVVLRLEGEWMKITIEDFEGSLLEYLFCDERWILNKLKIDEGSVIVQMAAPRSEMLSLLKLASQKYKEMPYLGIISVQVGSLILCAQKKFPYPYTFELGVSAAIVHNCSPALVECLLKLGANPNAISQTGYNLLTVAIQYRNTNVVPLLLKYKADPHMFDNKKRSAIHYGALVGQQEVVDLLLKAGVSPNHSSDEKITPLIVATMEMWHGMVQFLLQNGADVDRQTKEGRTALFEACVRKDIPIARLLLESGANPNLMTNVLMVTPFSIACFKGSVELAKLLLQFNADPNFKCTKEGYTLLMNACMYGYHNIVKLLLQSGAYVDSQTSDGMTAIGQASLNNNSRIISILLNANVDVNVGVSGHGSPLLILCSHSNNEMVERLLEAGADPDVVCAEYFNFTPLHFACAQNNEVIVRLLLKAKANTNVLSSKGFTPLCYAASEGNINIVEELLAAGADVELENDAIRGWRPIFFAAINGHLPILNLLLKHGASLKGDKFGVTPQAIAASMGHVEALLLLQLSITKSTEKANGKATEKATEKATKKATEKDVSGNNSTPELDVQTRNDITSHYKKFRSDLSSTMESFKKKLTNIASFATNISEHV